MISFLSFLWNLILFIFLGQAVLPAVQSVVGAA